MPLGQSVVVVIVSDTDQFEQSNSPVEASVVQAGCACPGTLRTIENRRALALL